MPSMSYCRFENTLHELSACEISLDDGDMDRGELSASEYAAAKRLIAMCKRIAENYGDDK